MLEHDVPTGVFCKIWIGFVFTMANQVIDLGRSNVAVLRYDTVFAHKVAAVETVTLTFENGTWSVTDYSVH